MPAPSVTEKFISGYIVNSDGDPEVGGSVVAALSDRIVRVGADNLVIEDDETVGTVTDGDGYWVLALHPNNQPGDSPLNTHWTITEPSGHTETIFIPYDHAQGGTAGTAIPYTSLIVPPGDLDPPENLSALEDRVDYIEATLAAMNTLNDVALDALVPPVPTDLVDAAVAASAEATESTAGLMPAGDKVIVNKLAVGGEYELAYTPRLVSPDSGTNKYLLWPTAADPTSTTGAQAWAYQSTADLNAKVQRGSSQNRTQVSPGLTSLSWQNTSDVTVTSTTMTNLTPAFAPVANSAYEISGQIDYRVLETIDLEVAWAGIPTGATLTWSYMGVAATVPAAGETTATVNPTRRTNTQTLTFGGTGATTELSAQIKGFLRVGATAGTNLRVQVAKKNNVAGNAVVLAGTFINLIRQA